MDMDSSSSSTSNSSDTPLKIGLNFGKKIYFEDVGGCAPPCPGGGGGGGGGCGAKKLRGGGVGQQQQQPPMCQVEGCNVDLSDAKSYYSRHKVCGVHSKTPKVVVNGLEQRFCQQCSRFHLLPEFDQGKRSCRRRLAGHNERRRKPPSGSVLSSHYQSVSSSIFGNNRSGSFLMDFSAYPRMSEREQWPTARASELTTDDIPTAIPKFPQHMLLSNSNARPPELLQASGSNVTSGDYGFPNSSCALSLLSNQTPGPKSQTANLGANYYVNPDSAHPVQTSAMDAAHLDYISGNPWGYKASGSHGMDPNMVQGHFPEFAGGHYGELELALQSGRKYMDYEPSRVHDSSGQHVHWSL